MATLGDWSAYWYWYNDSLLHVPVEKRLPFARTCATNINKELIGLAIEELIAQNVIFNKKTAQGLGSFYKLN